jgi:hypothetical protein
MAVQAGLIAGSTHSSNVKPRFRETADFARAIHSQAMPSHRKGEAGGDLVKSKSLLPRRKGFK